MCVCVERWEVQSKRDNIPFSTETSEAFCPKTRKKEDDAGAEDSVYRDSRVQKTLCNGN